MATTAAATTRGIATRCGTAEPRTPEERLAEMRKFVQSHLVKKEYPAGWFAQFETELHKRMLGLERDMIAEVMASADVDADAIEIEGKTQRRVLRSAQTYMTSAGEVIVERWLYKDRTEEEAKAVSPMELRLGIVGGFWTEKAAKAGVWVVTQMTPGKAAEMFERVGNMTPSKSSLGRLPKIVSDAWEKDREACEAALRTALEIPDGAVSVAVSIDGVLAPMEGTQPTQKRAAAAAEGRVIKGPVGYREVGCATLSFCDQDGEMLGAVRMARSPEANKRTLKASVAAELMAVLRARPALRVVKIADGVEDNWTFLSNELPDGPELLDFFHAAEHLHAAIAAAYGDATRETTYRYESLKETLREDPQGAQKTLRALEYLRKRFPLRKRIAQELAYFRKHRSRMKYAAAIAEGLPIGSGVVEAACKTLVTQRLKLSGMRWSGPGAQAVLTPRGWDQSERFDAAWALVAAKFQADIYVLANVVALKPPKPARPARRASR